MKKTDETIAASGLVLMISKAGRMVAAVECTEPGDHAVGQALLDHQGAEVVDVRDDVVGQLHRDALVGAQLRRTSRRSVCAAREVCRVDQLGSRRGRCRGRRPSCGSSSTVAEQGQVADVAAQQHLGGAQHPLLGALGQDDPAPVGAGLLQQLVLEHHRGDPVAAGDRDPRRAGRRCRRAARRGRARSPPCAGVAAFSLPSREKSCGGGGEAAAGHRDDRGAGGEPGGEREDLLARAARSG